MNPGSVCPRIASSQTVRGQYIPVAANNAVAIIPPKWIQRNVGDRSQRPSGSPMTMKAAHSRCMIINRSADLIINFLCLTRRRGDTETRRTCCKPYDTVTQGQGNTDKDLPRPGLPQYYDFHSNLSKRRVPPSPRRSVSGTGPPSVPLPPVIQGLRVLRDRSCLHLDNRETQFQDIFEPLGEAL